jgi:hypothetical protein
MLLLSTLLVAGIHLANVVSAAGDQNALFNCLKNKGYNLETITNPNFSTDTAAFNRRLKFQPVAVVFP